MQRGCAGHLFRAGGRHGGGRFRRTVPLAAGAASAGPAAEALEAATAALARHHLHRADAKRLSTRSRCAPPARRHGEGAAHLQAIARSARLAPR